MNRRLIGFVVILAAMAGPVRAADMMCTPIGCQPGANLTWAPLKGVPGRYDITITADTATTHCRISLPLMCDRLVPPCDDPGVFLFENGCALPPDAHSIDGVGIGGPVPGQVTVEILTPDGRRGRATETLPPPICHFPNGPGCDPTPCCQLQHTITLHWQ